MSLSNKKGFGTPTLKLKPVFLCVSAILGLSTVAHAEIINTNGAGVMTQQNAPTIVHINKPSDKGVSHNIYNKFDVDKNGVILNNSKDNINTQLGGLINGNLNLSGGTASVILNEVNSNNASTLNGMVEVAGDKAKVIIANPSGITCNNCGFINTQSTTLTTGKPLMGNGEVLGYNVEKGQIVINTALETDSPTDLLARSVAIKGKLNANDGEINIITGSNWVSADGKTTSKITGQGYRPSVGIDVSSLGGMYANKITLVTTENGSGVSNKGTIAAGDGGLKINSAGQLFNDMGKMTSNADISATAQGVYNRGQITAKDNISIANNLGSSLQNESGTITSTDGDVKLTSTGTITNKYKGTVISAKNNVDLIAADTIYNNEALIIANKGNVNIDTRGQLNQIFDTYSGASKDRIIAGQDITIKADSFRNSKGNITAGRDVAIDTVNDIYNISGSNITAKRKVNLNSSNLQNQSSSITATNGKMDITVTKNISNDAYSTVSSGKALTIKADKLVNNGKVNSTLNDSIFNINSLENCGSIVADTLNIVSKSLHNHRGLIDVTTLDVTASEYFANDDGSYIRAKKDIDIKGGTFSNSDAASFKKYASKYGLTNTVGGIESLGGGISIDVDNFQNSTGGLIKTNLIERAAGAGQIVISSKSYATNSYGEINSGYDTIINSKYINNHYGKIISGNKIQLNASDSVSLSGDPFTSKNSVEIITPKLSSNSYNIASASGVGIIYKPNGATIININKASDKGISHNTYDKFNVTDKGVIFNNSATKSQTTLAGDISGNSNITSGNEAKVILNEVVTNNVSYINGMMEVAGDAAQVIIANASGITCTSCGFINAERGAFITGKPLLANGNLIGYNVNQGNITVNNGLVSTGTIDLIGRSILINGFVKANELNMTAGAAIVDGNGNILTDVETVGRYPSYTMRIEKNGSLSANKIQLTTPENDYYGLANYGNILAGIDGLTINASALYNANSTISSVGDINITNHNSSTLYNDGGKIISTTGGVNITTQHDISNRNGGVISAYKDLNLSIGRDIQNSAGLFRSETGDLNANVTGTIYNWRYGSSTLVRDNFVAARDININAYRLINEYSRYSAGRDMNLNVDYIEHKGYSQLNANRAMKIDTINLTNSSSSIKATTGRLDITAQNAISNDRYSVISSDKLMNITAPKFTNTGVVSSNNGKSTFTVSDLNNSTGYIKGYNLNFNTNQLANTGGLIKADNNIVMSSNLFANTDSTKFKQYAYNLGLASQVGGIIADNGNIKITGNHFNNTSGLIKSNAFYPSTADINIKLDNGFVNNYGEVVTNGNLNITANTIDSFRGMMRAGADAVIKAHQYFDNQYGMVASGNLTKVSAPTIKNRGGSINGATVILDSNNVIN